MARSMFGFGGNNHNSNHSSQGHGHGPSTTGGGLGDPSLSASLLRKSAKSIQIVRPQQQQPQANGGYHSNSYRGAGGVNHSNNGQSSSFRSGGGRHSFAMGGRSGSGRGGLAAQDNHFLNSNNNTHNTSNSHSNYSNNHRKSSWKTNTSISSNRSTTSSQHSTTSSSADLGSAWSEDSMSVLDTHHGIEISLARQAAAAQRQHNQQLSAAAGGGRRPYSSLSAASSAAAGSTTKSASGDLVVGVLTMPPVRNSRQPVDFRDFLAYSSRKVSRAQLDTHSYPALGNLESSKQQSTRTRIIQSSNFHRVPLFDGTASAGMNSTSTSTSTTTTTITTNSPASPKSSMHGLPSGILDHVGSNSPNTAAATFEDKAFLLQSHVVKNELLSLQDEIRKLDMEMEAVEKDRMDIEHDVLRIPRKTLTSGETWDINSLLMRQQARQSISQTDLQELERKRGRCWTIRLTNWKAREALGRQVGYAPTSPNSSPKTMKFNDVNNSVTLQRQHPQRFNANTTRQQQQRFNNNNNNNHDERMLFFTSTNCHEAHNVRQLSFVGSSSNPRNLFLCKDTPGSAWGHVPPRLFRRMKKENLSVPMLDYLAVGRDGSYYAQFQTGHVWWGSTDPDCNQLLREWKVYRIAFGDFGSWMVVGRDGRVAWKNLPARLHSKLEACLVNYPAPSEFTLGPQGSYFIRFLDDSIDYCLPTSISQACEQITRDGGKITNIVMGDLNRDFIIRHTETRVQVARW